MESIALAAASWTLSTAFLSSLLCRVGGVLRRVLGFLRHVIDCGGGCGHCFLRGVFCFVNFLGGSVFGFFGLGFYSLLGVVGLFFNCVRGFVVARG